jgi:hypothetical protein
MLERCVPGRNLVGRCGAAEEGTESYEAPAESGLILAERFAFYDQVMQTPYILYFYHCLSVTLFLTSLCIGARYGHQTHSGCLRYVLTLVGYGV